MPAKIESDHKKSSAAVPTIWETLKQLFLSPMYLCMQWFAEENILWTSCEEGRAKIIVYKGKQFDHVIMSFRGYHINDPKKRWYKKEYTAIETKTEENGTETKTEIKKIIRDYEVVYHGRNNTRGFGIDVTDKETGNKKINTEEGMPDEFYDDRPALLKELGLYWVGFPWSRSVHVYLFEWNEASATKDTGVLKIVPRSEPTDFTYVADFPYIIVTHDAETKDRLPVHLTTQVTVAVRNPYIAIFGVEDWMQRLSAAINLHIRTFVGSRNYQDLIAPAKDGYEAEEIEKKWNAFSNPIINLNTMLPGDEKHHMDQAGSIGRIGAKIRAVDLQLMDLSGDSRKQHQEAASKAYISAQEAKAITNIGQANADVIEMIGTKEASALKKRLETMREYGDQGTLLAQLDAMRESAKGAGNTVVWANSPFVPFVPKDPTNVKTIE